MITTYMLADGTDGFVILIVVIASGIFLWAGYKRGFNSATSGVQGKFKILIEHWDSVLKKEQATLAIEEQSTGYLTQARIAERRRLLELAETSLNEVKRESNLEARCEPAGRAMLACIQHKVAVLFDKEEELERVAQKAVEANSGADKPYPVAALQKMQDLTVSAKRELDGARRELAIPRSERGAAFMQKVSSDVNTSFQATQRAKQLLDEAAAITKALGLVIKSPALEA